MAGKTDSVSIRVSYRNLKDTKVEMMGMDDEPHHRIDLNSSRPSPSPSSSSSARVPNGNGDLPPPQSLPVPNQNTLMTLILSCMVAAGVQFGWALQLSLLTPYIQATATTRMRKYSGYHGFPNSRPIPRQGKLFSIKLFKE